MGKFRQWGESFEFEGSKIGLEVGTYRLAGSSYIWQPALKA